MAASEYRAFCAVLHDITPHTWESYQPFIDLLDATGLLAGLGWSSRSALRRQLALRWHRRRLHGLRTAPCLRLASHPADLHHSQARRFWLDTVAALAIERRALTKLRWLEQAA